MFNIKFPYIWHSLTQSILLRCGILNQAAQANEVDILMPFFFSDMEKYNDITSMYKVATYTTGCKKIKKMT
jgi:hypothetical protein